MNQGGQRLSPRLLRPVGEEGGEARRPAPPPEAGHRPLVVGKGVACRGTLRCRGTIRVDGSVEGEIHAGGALLVGEGAVITARIHAALVVSRGTIHGDITAQEKVVLHAPARLLGSVEAPVLAIEEGAVFTGRLIMGTVTAGAEAQVRQAL